MGDLAMGVTIVAFFGVCIAYVRWCSVIIGPDTELGEAAPAEEATRA
jgi:hypothetical protein